MSHYDALQGQIRSLTDAYVDGLLAPLATERDVAVAAVAERDATIAALRARIAELEAGTPPEPSGTWWSHNHKPASGAKSFAPFDSQLTAAASEDGPIGTFVRGYSGSGFPATFAQTAVAEAEGLGLGAMLNVKCDWAALANGGMDSHVRTFFESWPASVWGSVTINHEPENDGRDGEANLWKRGIARFAKVAGEVIRRRDLDVRVGGCLMGFSFANGSTRWQTWDWWNAVDSADVDVCEFQIDMYAKMSKSDPQRGADIVPTLQEATDKAKAVGIDSWALFETAVDRRQVGQGDAIVGSDEAVDAWWQDYAPRVEALGGLRMACYFHLPSGEASAKAWLAGPSIRTFAKICLGGRRP